MTTAISLQFTGCPPRCFHEISYVQTLKEQPNCKLFKHYTHYNTYYYTLHTTHNIMLVLCITTLSMRYTEQNTVYDLPFVSDGTSTLTSDIPRCKRISAIKEHNNSRRPTQTWNEIVYSPCSKSVIFLLKISFRR